jgi:hypothetical protein
MATTTIVFGNLDSVKSSVLSADLSKARVSAMKVSAAVYKIGFLPERPGDINARICLEDVKDSNHAYGLTGTQLAALRVVTMPGEFPVCFVDEFSSKPNTMNLQEYTRQYPDASYDDMRFVVVAQLPLRNHQVGDRTTPIYADVCYEGYNAFSDATAGVDYRDPDDVKRNKNWAERGRLRNILHRTRVNKGMDTDENIERLPVFNISQ